MKFSYCVYTSKKEMCAQYGDYYDWDDAKEVCPEGWRLPSKSEYEVLIAFYGDSAVAADSLYSRTGFDSMLRGYILEDYLEDINARALFWTASQADFYYGSLISIEPEKHRVYMGRARKGVEIPVRCIRDDGPPPPESSSSSFPWSSSSSIDPDSIGNYLVDARDGQAYRMVTIGSQTWMAENLRYAVEGNSGCRLMGSKCDSQGLFYSFMVAQTACPEGWHLPSKGEYETLITTVGGESKAAAAHVLKSTSGWYSGFNGTDEYGFRIVPDGYRRAERYGYSDLKVGEVAVFWTSSRDEKDSLPVMLYVSQSSDLDRLFLGSTTTPDPSSVRCLKD